MSTPSAIEPLRSPVFRMLWIAWLAANLTMWANDVAAAWLMTTLTDSALMVALVQAATALPMLVLGLPAGALADRLDRRRLLLLSQWWSLAVATLQAGLALAGGATALSLLLCTLAFGCGMALRNPTYHALMPGLVPSAHLPPALALNAVAMNLARVAGPLAAGVGLVLAGADVVFTVVAALAVASILLVRRLPPAASAHPTGTGSLLASMRAGLAYATQSPPFRANLWRVTVYSGSVTALPALLPLQALEIDGHSPATYSLLFACMGVGAVLSTAILQPLRARFARDHLEIAGAVAHALSMVVLAGTRSQALAFGAMLFAGVAWIVTANSMTITTQRLLPDEFRARGVSIHQIVLMGVTALGSALWGQVATLLDIRSSLLAAAVCGGLGTWLVVRATGARARVS